jgi:heat shock protein HtpX
MSLYTYKESNVRKTWLLFAVFFAIVLAIGWGLSYVYNAPGILVLAALFSIVSAIVSYWSSDKIALSMAHAQEIKKEDNPYLWNMVENLSITAGLPMPRVYITPETQINAFATGRDPKHAAIAVTQGALTRLENEELEGVLAHELSHIGNRDILVSTVAVVLAGMLTLVSHFFLRSWFWGGGRRRNNDEGGQLMMLFGLVAIILAPIAATLIQLAISRRRESLADASGALLTRYPDGLAAALEKIAADPNPMRAANDATAHMWISNPFKGKENNWFHRLFMTHPPIEERIAKLRAMDIGR